MGALLLNKPPSDQATRTERRNLPTSCLRRLLSADRERAASSTCADARLGFAGAALHMASASSRAFWAP
jgi:hypothetical protein